MFDPRRAIGEFALNAPVGTAAVVSTVAHLCIFLAPSFMSTGWAKKIKIEETPVVKICYSILRSQTGLDMCPEEFMGK